VRATLEFNVPKTDDNTRTHAIAELEAIAREHEEQEGIEGFEILPTGIEICNQAIEKDFAWRRL